jgi:hypothetical protein
MADELASAVIQAGGWVADCKPRADANRHVEFADSVVP